MLSFPLQQTILRLRSVATRSFGPISKEYSARWMVAISTALLDHAIEVFIETGKALYPRTASLLAPSTSSLLTHIPDGRDRLPMREFTKKLDKTIL
jgi:hypothetical protein